MMESFNHFAEIAEQLHQAESQIVRKTAFDLQAAMQSRIRANGQIATSFMLNSVYTVTSEGSTYRGGANALPQVDKPEDDLTAYVAVAAVYGWWQNYGTTRIPARPFVEPAAASVLPSFEAALGKIEEMLHG